MEKTTRKTKKKAAGSLEEKIINAYTEYLLTQGAQPASVYKFCLDLGIQEDEFYDHFGSFEGLERHIWKQYITGTISRLRADKSFDQFSVQEKVLAFYYTLLETLKSNRSFVVHHLAHHKKLEVVPAFMKDFRNEYEAFVGSVLAEGQKNGEVASRPYLDKRYPQLFWAHFALLLLYWKEDDSPGFEKTDAYVEKSVRLAFDLIGKGVVDSALDFAKFIYQSKFK